MEQINYREKISIIEDVIRLLDNIIMADDAQDSSDIIMLKAITDMLDEIKNLCYYN